MAFDIFNPKAQPLIGLDISSSSVKLVEVADAGKQAYRIERYAIEALPKDAVVDVGPHAPLLCMARGERAARPT